MTKTIENKLKTLAAEAVAEGDKDTAGAVYILLGSLCEGVAPQVRERFLAMMAYHAQDEIKRKINRQLTL